MLDTPARLRSQDGRAKFKCTLELSLMHFKRNLSAAIPLSCKQTQGNVRYVVSSLKRPVTLETAPAIRQRYLLQSLEEFEAVRV